MSAQQPTRFDFYGESLHFLNAYQPIVDTQNGQIFAYEALLRGAEGESPFTVLNSVPKHMKSSLDQAVRESAIERALKLGLTAHLTLNMSTECLIGTQNHVNKTLELAENKGLCLERLIIEISESDIIHGIPGLVGVLNEIHAAGASVALDDFGAGYAGLNSLIDVNPDIIKLDMYLIRDIDRSGPKQATVKALVQLASDLGIDLIAEGIETEAERDFLNQVGIHLHQGFLYARPGVCCLPEWE